MSAAKDTASKAVTLDHPINKKISDEWVNLTPTLAEKWLGQNRGNRNMRTAKVKAFSRDMRNGAWGTDGSPYRFDWNGALMDGQHRCAAVIEAGATVRALVIRGLDPATREVMDTGTKRTPADALHFAGFEKDNNVTAAVAKIAIGRENGYLRTAFAGTAPNVTNTETVNWVREHESVQQAVALARATFAQISITPSPWAYCLYEMTQIDGQSAVEFATSMNEFRGLRGKSDARVAMLTAFRNAALGKRRVPSQSESIYIAFRAWNAWVSNKPLSQVIPRDANGKGNDIPKLVAPVQAFKERYL
jgi:hypothetical protein